MPPTVIYYTKPGIQPTVSSEVMAELLRTKKPVYSGNHIFRLGNAKEVPDNRRKITRLSSVQPDTKVIIIDDVA